MTSSPDILRKINAAVLDLQASTSQTFEHPLQVLGSLLMDTDLKSVNDKLVDGLDLDAFLAESERTQNSMIGSARLAWPSDSNACLGLKLLLIQKFAAKPSDVIGFAHQFYYTGAKLTGDLHSLTRQLIIPFVRDYREYIMSTDQPTRKPVFTQSRRVFIVHGHDGEAKQAIARFLEKLDFEAIILHEQASMGRTVIEKFEAYDDVGFAVVLLTPDDEGRPKGGGDLTPRARQNVVLELGFFLGRLGRDRVCALKKGNLEIPSDFSGVVWTSMDDNGWRLDLVKELKAVGYSVDMNKLS